ncbi:MAG: CRISPR-associated helicase Cas3' [Gammaproteobacteria bacterium]|nr:CRISPR-associated helicase Cas3' [Gammaproteobacteria bacterium]
MELFAHSVPGSGEETWESLEEHLSAVAKTAGKNAQAFGAGSVGQLAGWLHDLGKVKSGFQAKLRGESNNISHSGEGARFAQEKFGKGLGRILAYCIAGHHSGLPNALSKSTGRPVIPLEERLEQAENVSLPNWLCMPELEAPDPFSGLSSCVSHNHFATQFFTRMLFSALVDADFLETERFYRPDIVRGSKTDISELQASLNRGLARFGSPRSEVNRLRAKVLEAAGEAVFKNPGFFSLTVPTGGGKTLTSLKFALDHAAIHGMRRVIHVAPFTAITEQTADVFREYLGAEDGILEHHSAFQLEEVMPETEIERVMTAAQNWDQPVVVTTAVQLFESLFANRTQKCRKLHNIAQSVIILDEAQCLPLKFLRPCLAALQELVRGYGCSIVLCTATQPAVHDEDGLKVAEALVKANTREIAPNPEMLHQKLKRVDVLCFGKLTNSELADQVRGKSALIIVNNKRQARDLFEKLRCEGVYHLSTNMTAAHRRDVLKVVRPRLKANLPVLLVATALVEAGVDLDFPEVWRAVAGIDSIVQAAGRCNREGKMIHQGKVVVFEAEEAYPPPPELKKNAEVALSILKDYPDPLMPNAVTAYFRKLYRDLLQDLDSKEVMDQINGAGGHFDYSFADIAKNFRLIEDETVPLIIGTGRYGMDADAKQVLEFGKYGGGIARKLQPFTVQVARNVRARLLDCGAAQIERKQDFEDQFAVLYNARLYDDDAGFSDTEAEDIGNLIV